MATLSIRTDHIDLSITLSALSREALNRAAISFLSQLATDDALASAKPNKAWNVVLCQVGDRKIDVIKEIRSMTSLGLKEAKDATERGRTVVATVETAEHAAVALRRLRAAGADAEIEEAA